jgi:hypothetical protein
MSKRRRVLADLPPELLPNLLHQGGVSMKGLASLMATLRGASTSCEWDRKVLGQANHEAFDGIKCVDEVRLVSGALCSWTYADPCKLLTVLLSESVALQGLYDDAWARSPPTPAAPWSLVVAYDEFVPGNKLSTDQARKTMVVSFTFIELGAASLSRGTVWTTPVAVRSLTIAKVELAIAVFLVSLGLALGTQISDFVAFVNLSANCALQRLSRLLGLPHRFQSLRSWLQGHLDCLYKVDGGWSYMLRLLLERMLFGQSGLSTVGLPIKVGGQDRLLFAKLTNLLTDGDGHRMGWDWKGASSLKPCWKHFNVFKKDSGLAHRKPGYVEIDCTDPALLRSWSASQVYFAADAVAEAAGKYAAGVMSKVNCLTVAFTVTRRSNY